MDLDDDELKKTRQYNGATRISKLEDVEILTESFLSNCKNLDELQKLYIKLSNGLDKLIQKRQEELERGV